MKYWKNALITTPLMLAASSADALVSYNFAQMANTIPGERGFESYTLTSSAPGEEFILEATATDTAPTGTPAQDTDPRTFVYFDKSSGGWIGGLGVCGTLTTDNQCIPSSDDNVTNGEALNFEFTGIDDSDILTVSVYVNNNHDNGLNQDSGESAGSDKITVDGVDTSIMSLLTVGFGASPGSPSAPGKSNDAFAYLLGTFEISTAKNTLNLAYSNEQFYVSAMEITKTSGGDLPKIPEPATLLLTGLGFLGIGYQRFKLAKK